MSNELTTTATLLGLTLSLVTADGRAEPQGEATMALEAADERGMTAAVSLEVEDIQAIARFAEALILKRLRGEE